MVLLDPAVGDWSPAAAAVEGRQVVWLTADTATLYHCTTLPGLGPLLSSAGNVVAALDVPPDAQLAAQEALPWDDLVLVGPVPAGVPEDCAELVVSRLKDAGTGSDTGWSEDVYALGRAISAAVAARRLGPSQMLAFELRRDMDAWFDEHKAAKVEVPDTTAAMLGAALDRYAPRQPRRPLRRPRRPVLVHVTAQLVDGNHAPSRLLRTLLEHRDRQRFDVAVLVTEAIQIHRNDYPSSASHRTPSS